MSSVPTIKSEDGEEQLLSPQPLPASKTTTKLAGRQTSSGEISFVSDHKKGPSISIDPPDDLALRESVSGEAGLSTSPSAEDEEIQLAKAMILAMQSNPNATPDEIHAMLAKQGMQRASFTASKESSNSQPLIPGRLMANLMANPFSSSISSAGNTLKEMNWDKALKGLDDILTEGVSKLEEVGNSLGLPNAKPPSVPPPVKTNSPEETEKPKPAGGLKRSFTNKHKALRTPPISPVDGDKPVLTQILSDAPSLGSLKDSKSKFESPMKPPPIRLSGLAWKRRGGMGKFSSTAAWERRRIELQGNILLYYLRDASEETTTGSDYISPTKSLSADEDQSPEGIVVTKRATWLEQAAQNWIAGSDDPTAPRGYIDLVKEKATVQATTGDSGCPSPFAISIKVRGETKWKLCFDHHRSQMEWLVAITDIVVQNSVDQYNALLLQAADPAYQNETAVFRPPSVEKPPSKDNDKSHRLWMTEPYSVSSFNGGKNDAFDRDGAEKSSSEGIDDSQRSRVAESEILVTPEINVALDSANSSDKWKIPEKHLFYVFGVINVSLIYARASSTSLEGFWYLVSLANLGIYLCLSKDNSKEVRLMHAKVSTIAAKGGNVMPFVGGLDRELPSKGVARAEKTKGFVPQAGSTTVRIENPSDPPVNEKNEHFVGWKVDRGDSLLVRSHGYLSTKKKIPSPGELYDCIHMDAFESPHRYPDMGARVQLPEVKHDDGDIKKTWRAPDIFIVSIALPTDPPKLGSSSSDGGGYTITAYFRMKQETRDILKRVTAEGYDASSEKVDDPQKSQVNAVRLFEEWCRRAPTDGKFQSRFKIVPNAHNLKEIGMPGWIAKYNGTPFLIKRPGQTGFLFSHPELSCMEFDVSLHVFPYLAKQAICFMKESFFRKTLVTFGFVIEGRTDDELPECLIGLFQLCYPDPKYAIQAADFFSGKAQRSF
ncbi:hypothetical protein FisN_12Hh189 [Fistulifera solaris]|uniref:PH domain-containing protein n=1 Tax=Fistulifera solaris TaxID=1519565 RepID=A0A1Z5KBJ2_FISSO|nr:hypothetical protein FisN_12Hh189 [Fistulifera solaris]|eukprot:GAX23617.1 hypothetical protein FisN_12Hh189 [Fistulifera solaris]